MYTHLFKSLISLSRIFLIFLVGLIPVYFDIFFLAFGNNIFWNTGKMVFMVIYCSYLLIILGFLKTAIFQVSESENLLKSFKYLLLPLGYDSHKFWSLTLYNQFRMTSGQLEWHGNHTGQIKADIQYTSLWISCFWMFLLEITPGLKCKWRMALNLGNVGKFWTVWKPLFWFYV